MIADKRNGFTMVRLIAASLVIITHTYVVLGLDHGDVFERNGLIGFSKIGVDAFFVISGYLVTLSMLRGQSLVTFFTNRVTRIFPGLIVSVLVTVLVLGLFAPSYAQYIGQAETWQYLLNATLFNLHPFIPGVFTENPVQVVNGCLWTLPLEVLCYLGILVLAWSKAFNWRFVLLAMLVMFSLHMHDTFMRDSYVFTVSKLFLNELGYLFLYGALLAHLKDKVYMSWFITVPAVALVIWSFFNNGGDWHFSAGFYLVLWPYCLISICVLSKKMSFLNRFDYSYGIYIYGFVIQQMLVNLFPELTDVYAFTFLSLGLSLLVGAASWHLVEKPALDMKKRYFSVASVKVTA
ncbi:acyltransferase family protein [Pseudomonas phoenicis]|uniref:acyltransferase family protein n=1 Tax=unclassified Pseudomonas TaxID=196821 RepID=UPI0039A2E706